jgi:hypothetical protein
MSSVNPFAETTARLSELTTAELDRARCPSSAVCPLRQSVFAAAVSLIPVTWRLGLLWRQGLEPVEKVVTGHEGD